MKLMKPLAVLGMTSIALLILIFMSPTQNLQFNKEIASKQLGLGDYTVENDDFSTKFTLSGITGAIIRDFQGQNLTNNAINYSVQLEQGDVRILIYDENNVLTYEGEWINTIIKKLEPEKVDGTKIMGIGMSADIPTNRYQVRIEGKNSARGTVTLKWPIKSTFFPQ